MAQPIEDTTDKEGFIDELKPGTKLMHGQYTIENFLNAGGFGITYLARDSLDRKVVIKECFPGAFCRRSRYVVQARSRAHQNELKSIVRLFVQEARSLAKLDHPNIVGVHQVFEDNDTAYMALDFVEGRDLLDTIEDVNHGLTPVQIKSILKEVLGAVGFIHDQSILHRDISPDNILIDKELHPVLIDFGAAREEATKQSRVLSALRVVKDGYSPQEFYIAGSEQGPSSDLYALAASFYHLIVGEVPPNSQARLAAIASGETDPYAPVTGRFPEYDENFLAAIDKALAVLPKDRIQSAKEWVKMMDGVEGNVTPLNVAQAAIPAARPAPAAEQASKLPLLLGSAAVVALLVGVGVMTMSGGDDAPVAQTPVIDGTAVEETVGAETVTEPAPEGNAVAAALEEEVTATPADQVAEDAPVAIVRPALGPEAAAIAEVPATAPRPEPVATPDLASVIAEPNPTFPEQILAFPIADVGIASFDLPDAPAIIATTGEGPVVDIFAVTPGNEIIEDPAIVEPTVAEITSTWTVVLPFTPASETSNIIQSAGTVAPSWVAPGIAINSVNGTPISAINDIPAVLRDITPVDALTPTLPVTFSTTEPGTGIQSDQFWFLPVVQQLTLADGTQFETVFSGAGWRTTVSELAAGQTGGLQVGDVVTSYIPASEAIDGRDTLSDIFARERELGVSQFTFAVQRDGSLWVASLAYPGVPE
ncbi:serine/threonine protein kinase [Yoonia sp.]|uniref:serine/threonine protein kinase n=1 Tax=Yoonia sp. TaxID=2212373 RepID=UPI0035C7F107